MIFYSQAIEAGDREPDRFSGYLPSTFGAVNLAAKTISKPAFHHEQRLVDFPTKWPLPVPSLVILVLQSFMKEILRLYVQYISIDIADTEEMTESA